MAREGWTVFPGSGVCGLTGTGKFKRPLWVDYTAPGPKCAAWLASRAPMSFVMGPVGSAKTTGGPMKGLQIARLQHPSTKDIYSARRPEFRKWDGVGWRKAKVIAGRMNYRRMHDTLMPSYQKVFPADLPKMGNRWSATTEWSYEKNGPVDHVMEFVFDDVGPVRLHMSFRSVGEQTLESFVRGNESTAWWLNEVDEFPPGSLGMFGQRVGREYLDERPDPDIAPPVAYTEIFGDLNAPDEDNWFNEDYIQKKPDGFELFVQPSGFSPDAENLENLRRIHPDYYAQMAKKLRADQGEWAVRRFIENKPGISRQGTPVYRDFNAMIHVPEGGIMADPNGGPIVIGFDQGTTPAASFQQTDGQGRLLILDELVTEEGRIESAYEFGKSCGRKLLAEFKRFVRRDGFIACGDPAAKANESTGQFFKEYQRGLLEVTGYGPVTIAPTNNINARVGWINAPLRSITNGQPELLVDRSCRWHIRGFASGYKMVRVQGKDRVYRDKPDKGPYSHLMNGAEYGASRHARNAGLTEFRPVTLSGNAPFSVAQNRRDACEPVQVVMSDADL